MQYSQLASPADKQLFLIDFWATWCAPCINVSKYLNTLQEKYANQIYIVSLTEENPDLVQKFLSNHLTKLAVSLDYDSQNFKKYGVKSLPYGVLLSASGDVVWRGNPSDLKAHHIESFLRRHKQTVPIYNFLTYQAYQNEIPEEITLNGDFSLEKSQMPAQELPYVEQTTPEVISVRGSLQQIVAFLMGVGTSQIQISPTLNQNYLLRLKQTAIPQNIAEQMLSQLKISVRKAQQNTKSLQLTLNYGQLWSANEIDWGSPNPKIMVSEEQITGDNLAIRQILSLLSDVSGLPVALLNQPQYIPHAPFDWQIHYKFNDLLLSNLSDYGFKAEVTTAPVPVFILKPE